MSQEKNEDAPKFSPGDLVRHRASGELAVFVEVEDNWRCRVKCGLLDSGTTCLLREIEHASPPQPKTDDDGWIEHDPKGPIPESVSAVRFRDGKEDHDGSDWWICRKRSWDHTTSLSSVHITHYKP